MGFSLFKNALYLENEEEKRNMVLGGRGTVVQGDESHVFARKYNIGRVLAITEHGWMFGMVECGPDGRIWIEMVKDQKGNRLRKLLRNIQRQGRLFQNLGKHTTGSVPMAGTL